MKWEKILLTALLDFQAGVQFRQVRLANRVPNIQQYFSDVFALKSTLTLHTRANPVLRYLKWCAQGVPGIPFEEDEIYDGFSKVLFPISAKNRIPCVTPLVLLVKKVILKIQVKCGKSTSLEKSGSFLAKRASAQIILSCGCLYKELRGDTESSKNECHCDFFTVPWYKLMLSRCGTPSPL